MSAVAEAHLLELVHCPWCEPVSARLLARERLALDHDDVVSGPCEPVGGGCARGPATDDEDVARVRVSLPAGDGVAILVEGWLRALGDGHEVWLRRDSREDLPLVPDDLRDLEGRQVLRPCGHAALLGLVLRAVGVAGPAGRAERDPPDLVGVVGPARRQLAVLVRRADTTLPSAPWQVAHLA